MTYKLNEDFHLPTPSRDAITRVGYLNTQSKSGKYLVEMTFEPRCVEYILEWRNTSHNLVQVYHFYDGLYRDSFMTTLMTVGDQTNTNELKDIPRIRVSKRIDLFNGKWI